MIYLFRVPIPFSVVFSFRVAGLKTNIRSSWRDYVSLARIGAELRSTLDQEIALRSGVTLKNTSTASKERDLLPKKQPLSLLNLIRSLLGQV